MQPSKMHLEDGLLAQSTPRLPAAPEPLCKRLAIMYIHMMMFLSTVLLMLVMCYQCASWTVFNGSARTVESIEILITTIAYWISSFATGWSVKWSINKAVNYWDSAL